MNKKGRIFIKERTFIIEEGGGNLPYIVSWVSVDGRLCAESFSTYREVISRSHHLTQLGRQPAILLNLSIAKVDTVATKLRSEREQ